jgi:ABC-type Fe3+-hydroxamate transport system substrate-binding protein
MDNIASGTRGTVILSAERLIEADPDIILYVDGFADKHAIMSRSGFSELSAVKSGNVFVIDRRNLIAGAAVRTAIENLKKTIGTPEGITNRTIGE